jgi:uncharacterized integral membrane protein (TIGR00698 family)
MANKAPVLALAAQPRAKQWLGFAAGALLLIALTILVAELDLAISQRFSDIKISGKHLSKNPFEYPLTAVVIGLIANIVLRLTRLYDFVRPAIRTELYLKIGVVILGTQIALGDLVEKGAGGLIQAIIMVTAVFFFTWWLGGRLKLPNTLRAVMSTAVSICGVSAAIAAAGAVLAKKEEVTYVTTLVILTALPLMILAPIAADAMGLPSDVAGAWFGGNIDTTAAVVGAGTLHGAEAQKVAAVVKLSQNVLIGFAAFALSVYFSMVVERKKDERPSLNVIWQRFPKFVIGFVLASILASLDFFDKSHVANLKLAMQWFFALAFICIGLDLAVGELRKMGSKPISVYLAATAFNTVLALVVAWLIFGVLGA